MNIFVLGVTGRVGQLIVKKALADQHHVTALVRSPDKLSVHSNELTIYQGNALDQNDIFYAMSESDAVISALNTDKNQTLSRSMPLILYAMRRHGISRIVTIGTAGILDSRTQNGLYRFQSNESKRRSTTAAEDHLAAYELLRDSDLSWTVVCPTYLPDDGEKRSYRLEESMLPEDGKSITVGDTAAFAYEQLENLTYNRTRVGIAY